MRYAAVVALVAIALAVSGSAQHSAAHVGFSGHGGFSGHPGFSGRGGFASSSRFSGRVGFAGRTGFSSPGVVGRGGPFRYTRFPGTGSGRLGWTAYSGNRVPYNRSGIASRGRLYRPDYADGSRGRDRDRERGRRFRGSYGHPGYGYPGWAAYYPYPFIIDPGFYDWGDSDESSDDVTGGTAGNKLPPYADYESIPDYSANADASTGPYYAVHQSAQTLPATPTHAARGAYAGSAEVDASIAEEPLTLIFKNGRAPKKMQNYLMNSKTVTDLDQHHYEQIPLDQVDLGATEQVNRSNGVNFEVPNARD